MRDIGLLLIIGIGIVLIIIVLIMTFCRILNLLAENIDVREGVSDEAISELEKYDPKKASELRNELNEEENPYWVRTYYLYDD